MAYTDFNYPTKKALCEDFIAGKRIHCHQPGGIFPLRAGQNTIEGPHFPKPHKWYAAVTLDEDGFISHISDLRLPKKKNS